MPSINLSINFYLSGIWLRWQGKQGIPDFLLPSITFQLLLGDPKAFLGQRRYIYLPASFGCTTDLQRNASRRFSNQMPEPPLLAPFNLKDQLRCPNSSAYLKGLAQPPYSTLISAACIHNHIFWPLPKAHGQRWSTVKCRALPSASAHSPSPTVQFNTWISADAVPKPVILKLHFPNTSEKDTENL